MIRKQADLVAVLRGGGSVSKMAELVGATKFRHVLTETNEPVHGSAFKSALAKGELRVIASDLCGDPMQWGLA